MKECFLDPKTEREIGNLGYKGVLLLGHLIARAPVTGRLGPVRAADDRRIKRREAPHHGRALRDEWVGDRHLA